MSPDVELVASIEMLLAEAEKLKPLLESQKFSALSTCLYKMERLARVGTYCIVDIADFL